jgi:hypothetical protein
MRIQMIPKALAILLIIRKILDLIVCLVILDPFAAPEAVDYVLGFGGGEEDDCVLIYCCFEAVRRPAE